MTVVSSKDFAINQEKFFDLALDEQIVVKRGDNMFHITCSNNDEGKKPNLARFFGVLPDYEDGLEFQKNARNEWN
jgi:hypothetical protein